jgi:dihydroflavonol-4-reductase
MRATITGATGLVGSNLAIQLLEQGHDVRCTRRGSSKIDHLKDFKIEWVEADICDDESLVKAFKGSDVVFHCAAQVSIRREITRDLQKYNVDGTRCVIDAIKRAKVPRLVHCSSVAAIAISENGQPVNEDKPWNFEKFGLDDGYSTTKYEGQKLVIDAAAKQIDAVIVNPSYMLGPYDPKPSSGKLIVDVARGQVPGYTDGVNNFVDVRDVCRGMIAAWKKGRRGEMYILGNQNMTYEEIMALIARVAGVKPPPFRLPYALASVVGWFGDIKEAITGYDALINSVTVKYGYCKNYLFSSEKAKRELGYKPGPVENAVRDAITWFRKQGLLKT